MAPLYLTVSFESLAIPVLIWCIPPEDWTTFQITKWWKGSLCFCSKAQTARVALLCTPNTQHKLLSVRAIQKTKLLHYLLVKARSQDKKMEIWRHRQRDTDLSRRLNGRKAPGLWRTKGGQANCFTFIIIQGAKAEKKKQIKNCSAFQQGGEGQTQQETMHFNDYFSQLLED